MVSIREVARRAGVSVGTVSRVMNRNPTVQRATRDRVEAAIQDLDYVPNAIAASLRNLGGHDLGDLLDAFAAADRVTDRPSVVLAYTIKAWRLPTEGHPGNHSALLTDEQWHQLGLELGADPVAPWANFAPDSPEGVACATAARRLSRPAPLPRACGSS